MTSSRKLAYTDFLEGFLYVVTFISFIYFFLSKNRNKCFQAVLVICTLYGLRLLISYSKIWLPQIIKASILFFIFLAMILGNEFEFYSLIHIWDKILHSFSGILLTCMGFLIYAHINKKRSNDFESPLTVALFSLFFSIAAAGCWEIFEFTVDHLFGMYCQKNSLFDTMTDIICGTSGAIISTIYLYNKIKNHQHSPKLYSGEKEMHL